MFSASPATHGFAAESVRVGHPDMPLMRCADGGRMSTPLGHSAMPVHSTASRCRSAEAHRLPLELPREVCRAAFSPVLDGRVARLASTELERVAKCRPGVGFRRDLRVRSGVHAFCLAATDKSPQGEGKSKAHRNEYGT